MCSSGAIGIWSFGRQRAEIFPLADFFQRGCRIGNADLDDAVARQCVAQFFEHQPGLRQVFEDLLGVDETKAPGRQVGQADNAQPTDLPWRARSSDSSTPHTLQPNPMAIFDQCAQPKPKSSACRARPAAARSAG
jgi:hypothetical protein